MNIDLKLGLVCINTILRNNKPPVFCSRTCIRSTFSVEKAKTLALQNVKDISKLILWNEKHNIKCLRLSSEIFPHFTDLQTTSYDIDFAREELKSAGDLAKRLGHRIVMHPAQFNQVGAKEESVLQSTIKDLTHHSDILDAMGMDNSSVIIVHGGGIYNDRTTTIDRWIKQFSMLPDNVKRRLVIENCEKCYNTEHVLYIANMCRIPVVFDFHHYDCWDKIINNKSIKSIKSKNSINSQESIINLFPHIINTWKKRSHYNVSLGDISSDSENYNPRLLMHLSEQDPTKNIGAHSDYIETIPDILFDLMLQYNVAIDLEIEAKMKEQAILKLYQKYNKIYPHIFPYDIVHINSHINHSKNENSKNDSIDSNPIITNPIRIPIKLRKLNIIKII